MPIGTLIKENCMELVDFLKGLSQIDRERLGHMAGCTGAYVTSIIYKKHNTTSMALAIAIDKISEGKMDFRTLINRTEDVDWDYVKKALVERPTIAFVKDTSQECEATV